jgi:hypothetical protein
MRRLMLIEYEYSCYKNRALQMESKNKTAIFRKNGTYYFIYISVFLF